MTKLLAARLTNSGCFGGDNLAEIFFTMIRLKKFGREDYASLISWINSEEILIQIAGRQLSFPVTKEQLDGSQADKNRFAFNIINMETEKAIGHCELYLLENSAKIDRVIIGDSSMKGKGLCSQLINLLLEYGFNILNQPLIELYVFDWNAAAIRCYEKAGLRKNMNRIMEFEINDQKWIAFNMSIDKLSFEQNKNLI
ncbi:MAG TPA: GNAT family protein [Chitinophagaceae bacterium]|nr:GNAT family protein [Chitinophagaceae bacterium]